MQKLYAIKHLNPYWAKKLLVLEQVIFVFYTYVHAQPPELEGFLSPLGREYHSQGIHSKEIVKNKCRFNRNCTETSVLSLDLEKFILAKPLVTVPVIEFTASLYQYNHWGSCVVNWTDFELNLSTNGFSMNKHNPILPIWYEDSWYKDSLKPFLCPRNSLDRPSQCSDIWYNILPKFLKCLDEEKFCIYMKQIQIKLNYRC